MTWQPRHFLAFESLGNSPFLRDLGTYACYLCLTSLDRAQSIKRSLAATALPVDGVENAKFLGDVCVCLSRLRCTFGNTLTELAKRSTMQNSTPSFTLADMKTREDSLRRYVERTHVWLHLIHLRIAQQTWQRMQIGPLCEPPRLTQGTAEHRECHASEGEGRQPEGQGHCSWRGRKRPAQA